MNSNQNFPEGLTEEQTSMLRQFRTQVEDVITPIVDDLFLLRFLKARKFHIERAEKMFREHMKFRKNIGADTILKDYEEPEIVRKFFPYYKIGFDKDGDGIFSVLAGFVDYKGFFSSLSTLDTIKSLVCFVEREIHSQKEENERTGRNAYRFIIILDLTGLQLRQVLDRTAGKQLIDFLLTYEANYPERLKTVYVINVPNFFYTWFNVLKKFADPEPMKKFHLYSNGGWQEDILKLIDADILPALFGGKLTDPDGNPQCITLFTQEHKIPSSYYLKSTRTKFVKDPDMTEITVRERTYYNCQLYVKEPNSILRWFFQTLDFNIGFAIYYVPNGVKPMPKTSVTKFSKSFRHKVRRNSRDGHEILVPLERIESHVIPEQGELACEKTGTYLVHFDNTFSWMTPKILSYKIQVLPSSMSIIEAEPPRALSDIESLYTEGKPMYNVAL